MAAAGSKRRRGGRAKSRAAGPLRAQAPSAVVEVLASALARVRKRDRGAGHRRTLRETGCATTGRRHPGQARVRQGTTATGSSHAAARFPLPAQSPELPLAVPQRCWAGLREIRSAGQPQQEMRIISTGSASRAHAQRAASSRSMRYVPAAPFPRPLLRAPKAALRPLRTPRGISREAGSEKPLSSSAAAAGRRAASPSRRG